VGATHPSGEVWFCGWQVIREGYEWRGDSDLWQPLKYFVRVFVFCLTAYAALDSCLLQSSFFVESSKWIRRPKDLGLDFVY
jgi:hypothetical protein